MWLWRTRTVLRHRASPASAWELRPFAAGQRITQRRRGAETQRDYGTEGRWATGVTTAPGEICLSLRFGASVSAERVRTRCSVLGHESDPPNSAPGLKFRSRKPITTGIRRAERRRLCSEDRLVERDHRGSDRARSHSGLANSFSSRLSVRSISRVSISISSSPSRSTLARVATFMPATSTYSV